MFGVGSVRSTDHSLSSSPSWKALEHDFQRLLEDVPRAQTAPPAQACLSASAADALFDQLQDIRLDEAYSRFYSEFSQKDKLPVPLEHTPNIYAEILAKAQASNLTAQDIAILQQVANASRTQTPVPNNGILSNSELDAVADASAEAMLEALHQLRGNSPLHQNLQSVSGLSSVNGLSPVSDSRGTPPNRFSNNAIAAAAIAAAAVATPDHAPSAMANGTDRHIDQRPLLAPLSAHNHQGFPHHHNYSMSAAAGSKQLPAHQPPLPPFGSVPLPPQMESSPQYMAAFQAAYHMIMMQQQQPPPHTMSPHGQMSGMRMSHGFNMHNCGPTGANTPPMYYPAANHVAAAAAAAAAAAVAQVNQQQHTGGLGFDESTRSSLERERDGEWERERHRDMRDMRDRDDRGKATGKLRRGMRGDSRRDMELRDREGRGSHHGRDSRGSRDMPDNDADRNRDDALAHQHAHDHTSHSSSSASQQSKYTTVEQVVGNLMTAVADQHVCRFLQRKFDEFGEAAIAPIFPEVLQNISALMMDPFGNYLVQKLLEHCSAEQRLEVLKHAAADGLVRVALNTHGTRAVQKLIETLGSHDEVVLITNALKPGVVQLIKDLNGNHVIQRWLQKLKPEDSQWIYDAACEHCIDIAMHRHGCCVLQRCIDYGNAAQKQRLVDRITHSALDLACDPFGNYVVQYVLDLGDQDACRTIIFKLKDGNYGELSRQKFSSNVVEKCLKLTSPGLDDARGLIAEELIKYPHLGDLLTCAFGNYVVQSALAATTGQIHQALVDAIRPYLPAIKNTPQGKRIMQKVIGKV